MDIPEYYRQFQTQKTKKPEEEKKTDKPQQEQVTQKTQPKQETQKTSQTLQPKDKTILFQGNSFTLNQLEDCEDKTLCTLLGPVTDGIQHNVIIDI